mmetsp:Transcript_31944/g.85536  ORF Transcript_31944/g.85536 Transcript_31944/m.85536 type:complete len:194 (+) Transcript_31944:125-706(+)
MFAEKPVCTSLNCEAYISATNSRGERFQSEAAQILYRAAEAHDSFRWRLRRSQITPHVRLETLVAEAEHNTKSDELSRRLLKKDLGESAEGRKKDKGKPASEATEPRIISSLLAMHSRCSNLTISSNSGPCCVEPTCRSTRLFATAAASASSAAPSTSRWQASTTQQVVGFRARHSGVADCPTLLMRPPRCRR